MVNRIYSKLNIVALHLFMMPLPILFVNCSSGTTLLSTHFHLANTNGRLKDEHLLCCWTFSFYHLFILSWKILKCIVEDSIPFHFWEIERIILLMRISIC